MTDLDTGRVSGAIKTLSICADCREEDMYDVRLFVTREVCLLLEREGIELK